MKTINYIDEAKRRLGISSDYGMAKELGMTRGAFAHYKSGRRVIDDYTAAKLAEVLKINPLEVIAAANAEREKDSQKAEFWRKLASGAQGAILGSTLIFSGLTYSTQVVDNSTIYTLCAIVAGLVVMFIWRKNAKKENGV